MRVCPLRSLPAVVFAASVALVHPVSGQVCSQGVYKDFLALSGYPPAERFCSSYFPLPTTTITVTVTPGAKHRRSALSSTKSTTTSSTKSTSTTSSKSSTKSTTTSTTKSSTTSHTSTSTSADVKLDALVASATRKGGGFISTLCSCIETKKTAVVTSTAAPAPTCTGGVELQGSNSECFYYIFCDQTFVADSGLTPLYTSEVGIQGCVEQCDSDFGTPPGEFPLCRAFNYYSALTTNNCVVFQEDIRGEAFYHYDFSTPGVITGDNTMNGLCKGL